MRTEVLVIGGGAAGVEVAAALRRHAPDREGDRGRSGRRAAVPAMAGVSAGRQARRAGAADPDDAGRPRARFRLPAGPGARAVRLAERRAVLASGQEVLTRLDDATNDDAREPALSVLDAPILCWLR